MPLPIKVITNNTLIVNGQYESDGEVKLTIQGGAPYVYTGPGRISIGSSFIGVVDSGLPSWILENFDDDLAQLFDFYEGAFGGLFKMVPCSNMTKLIQQNDQSHYDCGQVLWWISDAAISQADIFGIWTEMVTSVTVEGQSSYDRELFFATLERLGADMGIMSDMQAILDGPNPNPDQTFRRLLESVNLSVEFQNGSLVYIAYPPQKG